MANEEHLILLQQGIEAWNRWRTENPDSSPDFSSEGIIEYANLKFVNLQGANLSNANLSNADLSNAILKAANFRSADLSDANLSNADLSNADLSNADLSVANLSNANLSNANLSGTNLSFANMSSANLSFINLSVADLSNANLSNANLSNATLQAANLSFANLSISRVLYTDFTKATLTGACIADWQAGSSTKLDSVFCDHIFRTFDSKTLQFSSRLPVSPNSAFAPGEFSQRFQILKSAQETIDITFTDGIDWQAFFRSLQVLRSQYPDTDISIQGMERKAEGFIVRLEVNQEADKAIIETQTKLLYADQLQLLEAQYEERLRLQGTHLEDIRGLLSFERQERTRLSKVVETMASEQKITQNFHAPVGNVAGTNYGPMTAYINQNSNDISRLLSALRETAQQFPEVQKDEVLMELEDLEADLKVSEKQEPTRIGKRLQRLMAAGTAAATVAGGAAAFSGNINEFTGNVLELAEKIGLSRDTVQPGQGIP